jgi:hypothetical protein
LVQFAISHQRIATNDGEMQRTFPVYDGENTPDKFVSFEIC